MPTAGDAVDRHSAIQDETSGDLPVGRGDRMPSVLTPEVIGTRGRGHRWSRRRCGENRNHRNGPPDCSSHASSSIGGGITSRRASSRRDREAAHL
jgi:hypothetical protein